ncbi:hypothetical protein [Actinosynnema mirum]|uniref:Uncharacterized protein n=1 Tax=Actinosynnema mirum (strain ATCC 29888 / DSM 43827 / JCM 3225 / NBRC 14064 / NCIMB 13271 / NRRL B-12336 / IMRU 3971 / 101) TaxID=446462 RepID=C6WF15_ACTMD|nr:hypothetical protein [Actinosynnema mirum]ACU34147.1 hypothetical protein Amir_0176 [Actinosynnema mirum DSM 43827]
MDPLTTIITTPALLITAITVGYLLTCAIWPFKRCRKCRGAGRHRSPVMRAYRTCGHCRGDGYRLRIGRHVWNALTRNGRARRANRKNRKDL